MNAFLVIARCLTDDVPLALFASLEEAKAFGMGVTDVQVHEACRAVYDMDAPEEVVGVSIVPFTCGRPGQVIWPIVPEAPAA